MSEMAAGTQQKRKQNTDSLSTSKGCAGYMLQWDEYAVVVWQQTGDGCNDSFSSFASFCNKPKWYFTLQLVIENESPPVHYMKKMNK